MRQVFSEFPWIHSPSPRAFLPLFQRYGHFETLHPGQAIYNGGTDGEVAWILSGLCGFQMTDAQDRAQLFTLVPAGRLIGNVDAYTGAVVNIIDYALRPTEVLLLSRHAFLSCLQRDRVLNDEHTVMLVREHESDMEGFFSIVHDSLEVKVVRLLAALIFRDVPRLTFHWGSALENFSPTPIPFSLSVTEIAKTVNASRTAVSLIMNQWIKDGLLLDKEDARWVTKALLMKANDWLSPVIPQ